MLTKTATIILGIIQKHPVIAYELIKMLSRFQLKDWYDIADSTVYATLKSLEKKQYITGRVQKDGNMPDKTVYSLTDAGTKEWNTAISFGYTQTESRKLRCSAHSAVAGLYSITISPTE